MSFSTSIPVIIVLALLLCAGAEARPPGVELKDGKLFVNGQWTFLKIAKPLRDFANAEQVDQLIADLDRLQRMHYNVIEINCYWHHFDHSGDGELDESPEPLRKLIAAIRERGMFPSLSVETYGVGGGQIPRGFWEKHPDAVAVNHLGHKVRDDEYGFGSIVPSLFSPEYLRASRNFIRNITATVQHQELLWFETTVEPQYMGKHALCYTPHARRAYESWLRRNNITGPAFPQEFPISDEFVNDPVWNRFRAEYLAHWVNQDAAVFREVAGDYAWIAVDYLETCGPDMRNRNGDSVIFLTHLTCANIIQVNWHWHVGNRAPNQCAYDNVRRVMRDTGRNWAITEHMTINGTDYRTDDMERLLRNTIRQSTGLGWEFVNVGAGGDFSVYESDWSPKPQMRVVEDNWNRWMHEIRAAQTP